MSAYLASSPLAAVEKKRYEKKEKKKKKKKNIPHRLPNPARNTTDIAMVLLDTSWNSLLTHKQASEENECIARTGNVSGGLFTSMRFFLWGRGGNVVEGAENRERGEGRERTVGRELRRCWCRGGVHEL